MKRSRFSKAQILKALKEMEARPATEVARKLGVAPATLYQWKSKYGGMTLSELKRSRELEAEKDRKSTRLNSSHIQKSRMPSSA